MPESPKIDRTPTKCLIASDGERLTGTVRLLQPTPLGGTWGDRCFWENGPDRITGL